MAATQAELEAQLTAAYAARVAVLGGQSKSVRGKSLTYPKLSEINALIASLKLELAGLAGRPTHTYIRRVRG